MDEVTPETTEGSDSSNKLECAVCLQPCIQPVELPCHHIFCYLCVKGVTQQSKRCAMCRQEIPLNYLDNPQLIAVEQPTVAFEGSYQWFYEGRNGWWQYDNRTSLEIEAAFKKGEQQCEVLIAGFLYIIDFQKNIQFRRCDPSRRRSIKRDLVTIPKKGIAGIRLHPENDILPSTSSSSDDSEAVCSTSSSDDSNMTVQTRLVLVPKPKVKLAVKKPKAAPSHPKVSKMVVDAIISLKERGGSSLQAIKKHISSCHRVVINRLTPFIKKFLKSSVDNGTLIQVKGKGARGSFKLSTSGQKTKDSIKMKKPKKESLATKKPKAPHQKVSEMVNDAIASLKEQRGSSFQAIKKHIGSFHKVNIIRLLPFIKKYLKSAVASGSLIQTKGRGARGSFKLRASNQKNKDSAKMQKPKKGNTPATKEAKTAKKKSATLKFVKATKMRKVAGYQKKTAANKMLKPKSFARKVSKVTNRSKVIKISKN